MKLKVVAAGLALSMSGLPTSAQDFTLPPKIEQLYSALEPEARNILDADIQRAKRTCEGHRIFAAEHDCSCITGRFVEIRLTTMPDQSVYNIVNDLQFECPNPEGMIAYYKHLCADLLYNVEEAAREAQCTCEATKRAEGRIYDMQVRGRWGRGQPDYTGECAAGFTAPRPADWPSLETVEAQQ